MSEGDTTKYKSRVRVRDTLFCTDNDENKLNLFALTVAVMRLHLSNNNDLYIQCLKVWVSI